MPLCFSALQILVPLQVPSSLVLHFQVSKVEEEKSLSMSLTGPEAWQASGDITIEAERGTNEDKSTEKPAITGVRGEKRLGRAQADFLILVTFIDPTVQKDNFLLSSPQKIPVMNAVKHDLSACFNFVEHSVQNKKKKQLW
ncbi:uncharacterized [Tachysurus ichikawai]